MRCIVTCGPSWEPIDRVRRLTNFSTGALGLLLASVLRDAGCEVLCLKGEAATAEGSPGGVEMERFSTNEDLYQRLRARAGKADAIFQTAALCDYRVKSIAAENGEVVTAAKIPTRSGALTMELEPAMKVIPQLRALFPKAKLVGWKYELDGTRADALLRATRQLTECATDASVVNGDAWGEGFGFLEPGKEVIPIATRPQLCAFLAKWATGVK